MQHDVRVVSGAECLEPHGRVAPRSLRVAEPSALEAGGGEKACAPPASLSESAALELARIHNFLHQHHDERCSHVSARA